MPRTAERSEVSRRLGGLSDPEPASSPPEFTAAPPHPPRWHEESLDRPEASVSGCRADGFDADPADGELEPPGRTSTPAWLSEPCGSVSLWHERLVPERFRGTRWDPGPRGVLVLAAVAAIVVVLAALASFRERPVAQAVPPITVAGGSSMQESAAPGEDAANPGLIPGVTSAPKPSAAISGVPTARANPSAPPPQSPAAARNPSTTAPAEVNGHAVNTGELVVSVIGLVEHGGLRRFPPGARIADALRAATPRPEADLSGLNLAQHLCDGDQIIIGRNTPRPGPQQVGSTVTNAAATTPAASSSGPRRTSGPAAKVNLNTATESELDTLPGVGPVTARAILAWRTQHGRFTTIDQLAEIEGIGPARLNRLRSAVTI